MATAEESDASSDLYDPPTPSDHVQSTAPSSTLKRKLDDDDATEQVNKKVKASPDFTFELWHHVFTFCPPRILAILLSVSRPFHQSLTDPEYHNSLTSSYGTVRPLSSSEIWQSSKARFTSNVPPAIVGKSDLQMWRLLKTRICQSCQQSVQTQIIFSFGLRLCSKCLRSGTETDADLFLSSESALRPLLPFAFLSSDDIVIPTTSIRKQAGIEFDKVFWTESLQAVQEQLASARSIGDEAAKHKFKELTALKNDIMKSVETWEVWMESGEFDKLERSPSPQFANPAFNGMMLPPPSRSASIAQPSQAYVPKRSDSVSRSRDPVEIQEKRAVRRADIEQRCLELVPPISTNLLPHMESFQAALQITTPMTDQAWEILRPRLVAQRQEAERRENERIAEIEERRKQEESLKEIKESAERKWNESQKPIRDLLEKHADDIIQKQWADGSSVAEHNSAFFAAQVLTHVRARFFNDPAHQQLEPSPANASQPLLVLENMKWVYDNKIKPVTDPLGGCQFVCNGCNDSRFKALDGVIQHYASKHTNDFSIGKTVVSWQSAAWPEVPPFKPEPSNADVRKSGNSNQGFRTPSSHYSHSIQDGAHMQNNFPAPQPERTFPMPPHYGMSPAPFGSPVMATHYIGPPGVPPYSGQHPGQHPAGPQPFPIAYHPGYANQGSPFGGQNPYYVSGPSQASGPQTPAPSDYQFAAPIHMPNAFPPMWTPITNLYQSQKNVVAEIASGLWLTLSSLPQVPLSVKAHVVIHHVISRFHQMFSNEPSLDLFTDSLNTHPGLRTMKLAAHIGCKTCVHNNEVKQADEESKLPSGSVELHTFYSLLAHFRHVHVEYEMLNSKPGESTTATRLDWKYDMIELPPDTFIKTLWNTTGMTQAKIDLLAEVMPLVRVDAPSDLNLPSDYDAMSSHAAAAYPTETSAPWNPESRGDEYDPTQPISMSDFASRGRNSGHRSAGDHHPPQRRDSARHESHNTTPASQADGTRRPGHASGGPSPVDSASARSKPSQSTSPGHAQVTRAPGSSVSSRYSESSPPERYADEAPIHRRHHYSDRPHHRSTVIVERAPAGRTVYREGYIDDLGEDDVEYVYVRRRDGRFIEYPPDEHYVQRVRKS